MTTINEATLYELTDTLIEAIETNAEYDVTKLETELTALSRAISRPKKVWAEFVFWQDNYNTSLDPYFNIKGDHEALNSTVSKKTLAKLGITDLRLGGNIQ